VRAGKGAGVIAHFVPFHLSASSAARPERPRELPTVIHAVGEVHDTALSWTVVAPAGFGVGWIVHFVPFHRSTSGASVLPWPELPTAVHAFDEVHETP
jgi:hypothetical protein